MQASGHKFVEKKPEKDLLFSTLMALMQKLL